MIPKKLKNRFREERLVTLRVLEGYHWRDLSESKSILRF